MVEGGGCIDVRCLVHVDEARGDGAGKVARPRWLDAKVNAVNAKYLLYARYIHTVPVCK